MKILPLILLIGLLHSCTVLKDNKDYRLTLNPEEVKEITISCESTVIPLDSIEKAILIEKINTSKNLGPVKGIVRHKMVLYLNTQDTINIRLLENMFKWDKGGDWAFQLDLDTGYFNNLCHEKLSIRDSTGIPNPIE